MLERFIFFHLKDQFSGNCETQGIICEKGAAAGHLFLINQLRKKALFHDRTREQQA